MTELLAKQIEAWHEFYVLLGSGAAALTGLLFVIVSLGARVVAKRAETGVKAFVSPIAVHFTFALVASALMLVPAVPSTLLGAMLAIGGLGGVVYTGWTGAHALWRRGKLPVLDWIWFVGLPSLAFLIVFGSGIGISMAAALGLYGIAAATALLIIVGIRNAWDIVIWMTQQPPA